MSVLSTSWLKELAEEHRVTGAAVAVLDGDQLLEAQVGVAHPVTRQPVTAETLFQIGSVSKLYTASLVVLAADSGRLSLDDPVGRHVPEVRSAAWADEVTLRMLLAHTSGIDGDLHLADTGRGDDAVARYASSCAGLPLMFAPGDHVSYCNAGYVLLGRALEHLHAASWEKVVEEHLLGPVGLSSTTLFPEQALLAAGAVGSLPSRGPTGHRVVPVWSAPRSTGPAGGSACASAADVARFGAGFFAGRSLPGLPGGLTATMTEPVPPSRRGTTPRGLGWELVRWPHGTVLSHDGANSGQCAALRVLPEQHLAVAVLTNWARAPKFNQAVVERVVRAARQLEPPGPAAGSTAAGLSDEVLGTYRRLEVEQVVTGSTSQPELVMTTGAREQRFALHPLGSRTAGYEDPVFGPLVIDFLDGYASAQGRVARRAG